LEERGIVPGGSRSGNEAEPDEDESNYDEEDYDEAEDDSEESDLDTTSANNPGGSESHPAKGVEEVSMSEIQDAILRVLSKCPNQSSTIHSMTARVLKELEIVTRGNPRIEFERRVMRSIGVLEGRELIEKYKAKNRRVRLIRETA
jgi:hypothetical protein